MSHPLPLFGILALLASVSCAAPAPELFNGRDLAGWEFTTSPATAIATVHTVAMA